MDHGGSIALVTVALVLALAPSAAARHPEDLSPLPAEAPELGISADGLDAPDRGPCAGTLAVDAGDGREVCTHGPDPAPAAAGDVRERRTVRELRATASDSDAPRTSGSSAVACHGDGASGNRIQAVYARVAGSNDRYAKVLPLIRDWAGGVDAVFRFSAQRTGGFRTPLWVTTPDCSLSVGSTTISERAARNHDQFLKELSAKGYNRPSRKYLVWTDANEYCGIGEQYPDDSKSADNSHNGPSDVPGMIARVDNGCWGLLDSGVSSLEAHELTHMLGGVQETAPNATYGGHCIDEWDTLCYDDEPPYNDGDVLSGLGDRLLKLVFPSGCAKQNSEQLLDCRGDDYFNTSPSPGSYLARHWNVADNSFLTNQPGTPGRAGTPAPPPAAGAKPLRTKIVKGPKRGTEQRRPRFRFEARGAASFSCRLDRAPWAACESPVRTGKLAYGRHRFRVLARDAAGAEERRPVYWSFRVER